MRAFLTYSILLILLSQCKQQSEKDIVVKSFYDNGTIKDSITLNSDSLKNGKCFYFDDQGVLDSTVTFKNGKRNGLKSKFFGEYGVYTYNYKNDSLIEERTFDTLNKLVYIAPLNIKSLPKTTFHLLSNKTYLSQNKIDTLTLINSELPSFNRGLTIVGATFRGLKEFNTYEIKATSNKKSVKNIIILVKIFERYNEEQIPTRIDTLLIPLN